LEPGQPSAWDTVLDEIGDDGAVSKDTALRMFALAFGDMPGVELPSEPEILIWSRIRTA